MNYEENLKKIREENNLSQSDMANILNIKRVTYNHFETQYDIIPLKYLEIISNLFQISIDYILGLSNIKNYSNSRVYNLKIFSVRLKEFRKENKLTQEKLATSINTVHSTIVGYENERCFIRTSFLYTICKKYKISADYLLGKIDTPKYLK